MCAALTPHTVLRCQEVLSYICVSASSWSRLQQSSVRSVMGRGQESNHTMKILVPHVNLMHTLTDGGNLCKLKSCSALWGLSSVITLHLQQKYTVFLLLKSRRYCRKWSGNKAWRREQICNGDSSAGSGSQWGLWQWETLAQREAQRDLRDDFLLCHACAHTDNLPQYY